uniref:2,4-dienoyl-CoA reductase (NADPH) n=1 Tax=uncultured bacterium TB157_p TaxID=1552133 RepID=A0A0K0LBH1_9BACT|nr:2,4-dienoyl-CoA reductase (NADPH) [uncultured bacterium TB157_p]
MLSQFLSPRTNLRSDQWGRSLENRARLLITIVDAIRARVQPAFAISVKLNSADFQKGGFEPADAKAVVEMLNMRRVDLVEISGGSYESPAMHGGKQRASTIAREAYFIDFARYIQAVAAMPIMVTGGITRRAAAAGALANDQGRAGVAMVGIAQAFAFAPDLARRWKDGEADIALPSISFKKQAIASLARMSATKYQLRRMGRGKAPCARVSPLRALILQQLQTMQRNRHYQRWQADRAANA